MRPHVEDAVEWAVRSRSTFGWLGFAAESALSLGMLVLSSGSGWGVDPDLPDRKPRLPPRPDQDIPGIGIIVEGGVAPWMPSEWADRPRIEMTTEEAHVRLPIGRTVRFDPRRMKVVETHPDVPTNGLPWDTKCRMRVVGHENNAHGADASLDLRLRGTWLSFAWLGHLGGWPQPAGLPPASAIRRKTD